MARETMAQMRATAMGSAQSYLRRMGVNPATCSAEDAWGALGDVARLHPDRVAAAWFRSASDHQYVLFRREWTRWARAWHQMREGM